VHSAQLAQLSQLEWMSLQVEAFLGAKRESFQGLAIGNRV
jgi:hypothetical protein